MNPIINKIFRICAIMIGLLVGSLSVYIATRFTSLDDAPAGYRLIYHPVLGWDSASSVMPLDKNTPDKPVVFFLGDSFVDGKKWPQMAQDMAFKKGILFSGYSLGVSGYGTVQSFLKLKHLFESKQPNLVILLFYAGNDIRDNYNNPPIYYNYGGVQRPYIRETSSGFEIVPLSWIYRLYMELTNASFNPQFSQWNKKHLKSFKDPDSWAPFYRTTRREDPYVQGAWRATEGALTLMKKFLDEKGVPLLVLGIDSPFTVDNDVYQKHVAPLNAQDISIDLPMNQLGDILRRLRIPFVLCTPQLRQRAQFLKRKIYDDPSGNLVGHLQASGEDVVGRIAAEEIERFLKSFR